MNHVINIIGICGSVGIAIAFIPQTYKTITSDDNHSVSFSMIFLTFLSSICMTIYSIYYYILPMIITNISVLINTFIIMVAFIYKKNNSTQ